jgi:hypothetical protein
LTAQGLRAYYFRAAFAAMTRRPDMPRKTQKQEILEFLQTGREITPMDALGHFGCFRLAARIDELRAAGWPIVDRWMRSLNGRSRFKAYRLDAS